MSVLAKGYQVFASSAVLDVSGDDEAVYGVNIVSDTTAGVVTLRDGTSGSATAILQLTGTISKGVYIDFGQGIIFPGGCYVSLDAHVTAATVCYERV